MRNGQPAANEIRDEFGSDVFNSSGEVDKSRLASRVFDNAAERKALEHIIHPRVQSALEKWRRKTETKGRACFAVAAIPLLFENGRQNDFDQIIVTFCSLDLQIKRLKSRGLNTTAAQKRIDAQLPTATKVIGADFTINTEKEFKETDRQIDEVCKQLNRKPQFGSQSALNK